MHAIVLHELGPADNLLYEEVPDPVPGVGLVSIAVEVAGVHFVDTRLRGGNAGPLPQPELPAIPGREVAGVVDGLGDGADPSWLGKRVAAHLGFANGGYAERAVCPTDALFELPDGLGAEAAIAMVGTGRTTALVLSLAGMTPGDTVLVTAAAGGIGSLIVQEATAVGAAVVGLAGGPDKVKLVRSLGADAAVDYNVEGWADVARHALDGGAATLLFDGVAGELGAGALGLLGDGGRCVAYGNAAGMGTESDADELRRRGIAMTWAVGPRAAASAATPRELQTEALAKAASGRWNPPITAFALRDAAAAHRAIESRATVGKVVLTTSG